MSEEKKIPADWEETTLNAVAEIKYGKDHKHLKDGNIPCLGSGGLMRFVDEILYDKPSVLIPRKGTISNLFFIDEPFWTVDTLFYTKINENKIISKYLYFKLKTINLENMDVGSAVPSLTTAVLNQIEIVIPKDIEEQKSIVEILTSFDNKIELLQAQNKTLEATTQVIFAEWFGKYSVEDELPDGWRVGRLEKIIKYIIDNRGKTPPTIDSKTEGYPLIEVNSITGNDRNININVVRKFVDNHIYENWFRKGHPIKGDILISTVGSIGQLGQVYDEKICIAQNIVALRSTISGNFLYELLKFNQKEIISIDISSVQPSIKVPHLLNIEIIIPDDKTIQKFDTAINSLTNKLFENYKQINMLIKTRDEILPKLLNGMIRIKNN